MNLSEVEIILAVNRLNEMYSKKVGANKATVVKSDNGFEVHCSTGKDTPPTVVSATSVEDAKQIANKHCSGIKESDTTEETEAPVSGPEDTESCVGSECPPKTIRERLEESFGCLPPEKQKQLVAASSPVGNAREVVRDKAKQVSAGSQVKTASK